MEITVIGAGAWGTAMASHLAAIHDVKLWARNTHLIDSLQKTQENKQYLSGCPLNPNLQYESDLKKALNHVSNENALLVIATPIAGLRDILKEIKNNRFGLVHFIWLSKGLETNKNVNSKDDSSQHLSSLLPLFPHEIVLDIFDAMPSCGVLSGPSFAREVVLGKPVALTIASHDLACCQKTVAAFHHGKMRIYTSNDLIGVEVGAAVKNVLAIATGISDGLDLGLNARAALMTRGLAEMTRLGVALGAKAETFLGLSGVGDLILTATGDLSRNRTVGMKLAKGETLSDILQKLGHVAEGVQCALSVLSLAEKHKVDMPITKAVCDVLTEKKSAKSIVSQLLNRESKNE